MSAFCVWCVICIVIVGVHDSRQHGDGALISRNTFRRRSFITLKCPEGYLFTNLKFKLDPTADKGSSKCDRRGTEARRRCRWRQTCRVDTNLRGCNAAHMQLSNFKCIPQDNVLTICRSDNGAVWITNFGRLKRGQVKAKCKRILRKNISTFRIRRDTNRKNIDVKGVVTQVNGIIQDRIGWQKKTYTFSCPKDSVIHSIDFYIAGRKSTSACRGISPQLLVQKNNCFWKTSCKVSWEMPQVIAIGNHVRCVGKEGSLFTTKGHQCIPKRKIHDICRKREAKGRNGLLRSHSSHPWNYRAKQRKCKTIIKINHEGGLYLRLHDIDLDFSHDDLTIVHVRRNNTCTLRHIDVQEGVWLHGGHVEILFRVLYQSKSGRGFIISYKNVKTKLPRSFRDRNDVCEQITSH
ncbi:uncharacterized protein LOC125681475 [Ostrea edulis]|uniref:uncharacterized protein LOC125681475 n=1 Tax=Ostrea edulis TaxID=37623 RepID=UPI0024AEB27F|nr:uncharacterized protein LOC125681475 [Ostrea edulis]